MEIRPIPGFDGYGACSNGHIWRITRPKSGPGARRSVPYKLESFTPLDRYPQVNPVRNGRVVVKPVHYFVALAWLPKRLANFQVAHGDGDKTNNAPSNLRWATALENSQDRIGHGRSGRGEKNHHALLSRGDVEWIHAYPKERGSIAAMAKRLQVTTGTVSKVLHGRTWAHV